MASTIEYLYYDAKSPKTVNEYDSDGHGDEPRVRTCRHMVDGQHLRTSVRGYNCPADAEMASLTMEIDRAMYERHHGGSGTPGLRAGCRPVTHIQWIISWAPGEWLSPMDRHEMMAQLICVALENGCCMRAADHNNTHCLHGHISVCVYVRNGRHKMPTSIGRLNDLRRKMDRICAEYKCSIIENPVLCRDAEYAEWFTALKEAGEITIHPPRAAEEITTKREWEKPKHPKWDSQTAGRYFYQPPWRGDSTAEETYCPATRVDSPFWGWGIAVRKAPLPLLMLSLNEETNACEEELIRRNRVEDRPRIERLHELRRRAVDAIEVAQRLDVGTRADIGRHLYYISMAIEKRKKYKKFLEEKLENADAMPPQKVSKLLARWEKNEVGILLLQQEKEELMQLKETFDELRDPQTWSEYSDCFSGYIPKYEGRKPYIRQQLRYLGQLIGAPDDAVEEEMRSVLGHGKPAVARRGAEVIVTVTGGIAEAMASVAKLCNTIDDPYSEHEQIEAVRVQMHKQINDGTLLRGMLALGAALMRYEENENRVLGAALVRSAVEDVQWHLQNALAQVTTAQSVSTLRIAYGELTMAMEEWRQFAKEYLPRLVQHTYISLAAFLREIPCPDYTLPLDEQVAFDFVNKIKKYRAQVERAKDRLDRDIVRRYGSDPRGTCSEPRPVPPKSSEPEGERPSLDDLIARAKEQESTQRGERSRDTRDITRQR